MTDKTPSDWRDSTSYSQNQPRVPSWWVFEFGGHSISVGNTHIYYKNNPHWLMLTVFGKRVELAPVLELTEESAKAMAIELTRKQLVRIMGALDE